MRLVKQPLLLLFRPPRVLLPDLHEQDTNEALRSVSVDGYGRVVRRTRAIKALPAASTRRASDFSFSVAGFSRGGGGGRIVNDVVVVDSGTVMAVRTSSPLGSALTESTHGRDVDREVQDGRCELEHCMRHKHKHRREATHAPRLEPSKNMADSVHL